VTGVGTVLADDPSLNVRLDHAQLPGVGSAAEVRQPLRVVLDSRLRTPVGARLPALPGETLVIGGAEAAPAAAHALRAAGAQVVQLAMHDGHLDLAAAFGHLAQREVNEVLLECGPTLAGAALQAGLVDEIVLYLAPHLMGDAARGLFTLPGLDRMSDRLDVSVSDVRSVGVDLRLTLVPGRQV
jgi:diaminohydroxyphosphoribosylaminopyrimidine deaminase/5-amino-6-(5-phosphoribosylamino)uracil reductase